MECDEVVYIFFFSSRRRHTRYWRDWSSDVCSSDLSRSTATSSGGVSTPIRSASTANGGTSSRPSRDFRATGSSDRKSVGVGKRVDLGGRRIIKKKPSTLHHSLARQTSLSLDLLHSH